MADSFSIQKRIKSFGYACKGICVLIRSQHNAWIHSLATLIVVATAYKFQVTKTEWMFLILAIALVWMAEGMNTAIEFLCDHVSPDHHPLIEKSKDVAAGAVLLAAIGAAIVGLMIFIPYFS